MTEKTKKKGVKPVTKKSTAGARDKTKSLNRDVDRLFNLVSKCIEQASKKIEDMGPCTAIDVAERAARIIIKLHEANVICSGDEAKPQRIILEYADRGDKDEK